MFCSYESTSVEDLYQLIFEEVQHQKSKIEYLAFILSGSEKVKYFENIYKTITQKYLGIVPM